MLPNLLLQLTITDNVNLNSVVGCDHVYDKCVIICTGRGAATVWLPPVSERVEEEEEQ